MFELSTGSISKLRKLNVRSVLQLSVLRTMNCSARLQRRSLRPSLCIYISQYIKGQDNDNSDLLSRLPIPENDFQVEPCELIFVIDTLKEMHITCDDIKNTKTIKVCVL